MQVTTYSHLAQNWNVFNNFSQNLLFHQNSQLLCQYMQKKIENIACVQAVSFEFYESVKNKGTKYMLIFDNSCEQICNSKAFIDIATAGRHRLSTIYKKHNLFHQSKLGRDLQIQNHIVLFKCTRKVMQVSSFGAQLGVGSELVDWYQDTTSILHGQLLIDLSPRTDNRLSYCTNAGYIRSIFYITERLKQLDFSDDGITKCSYPPSVPIVFQKCKSRILLCYPKEFLQFLYECIMNLLKRNLQRTERHHLAKYQKEIRLVFLKQATLKQRRDFLASKKGLRHGKVNNPFVINHLFWRGAICSHSCFCVRQEFEHPVSYRAGTSTLSTFTQFHLPNLFA